MTKNPTIANPSPRARLTLAALLLPSLLLAGSTGCTKYDADLKLQCLESSKKFTQEFQNAYVSSDAAGNTEVVLVNEPAGSALRQVMHVKVLWRPLYGAKQPHASLTNASFNWYVLGQPSASGAAADVLEYTGAGFVAVSDNSGNSKVTIRNATLKPVQSTAGSLSDPVGPSRLDGTFVAERSKERVSTVLAEVNSAIRDAKAQHASAR